MKELIILRGLPGSGKSGSIQELVEARRPAARTLSVCSADHFFMDGEGNYLFDSKKIGQAHAACQEKALLAMHRGESLVVIDNTNSCRWEYALYRAMAGLFGYKVTVKDLFDGGCTDEELAARNVHGAPVEVIAAMRARWEP